MQHFAQKIYYLLVVVLFSALAYYLLPRPTDSFSLDDSAAIRIASGFAKPYANESELYLYPETYVQLGKLFFFDKRFSAAKDVSCATCHQPERFFTDGFAVAKTSGVSQFNTPSLINVSLYGWFFWDGRKDSLAAQAHGPIENKDEHNFNRVGVYNVILNHYKREFELVFGNIPQISTTKLDATNVAERESIAQVSALKYPVDKLLSAYALKTLSDSEAQKSILRGSSASGETPADYLNGLLRQQEDSLNREKSTAFADFQTKDKEALKSVYDNFGRAIAAYEERLLALNSPFDVFVDNLNERLQLRPELSADILINQSFHPAFGKEQWEGFKVYAGNGRCISCHFGLNFSDSQFHNIGLPSTPASFNAWPWGRALGLTRAGEDESKCLESKRSMIVDNGCVELPQLDDKNLESLGAFKTPTLRNLAFSAPYMHDGRFPDIASVLNFYSTPLDTKIPWFGHAEETLGEILLTPSDQKLLETFLESLNDRPGVIRASTR